MRAWTPFVAVVTSLVGLASSWAHIAPAVQENNRYLVIAPLGDRVRLSYTVFFGQVPGLEQRIAMDTDKSGTISTAERDAFVKALGRAIGDQLDVRVEGRGRRLAWADEALNFGDRPDDGAFRVDFRTELCLASDGTRVRVELRDSYVLDHAGEGELRLEATPGVQIHRAGRAGEDDELSPILRWSGSSSPLSQPGYVLEFTPGPDAFRIGECSEPSQVLGSDPPAQRPIWQVMAVVGFSLLSACALGYLLIRGRRARAGRGQH